MFRNISYLLISLVLVACHPHRDELHLAEQVMERHPDSALHILQRIPMNDLSGKADRALFALLMSQAMDKNDIKSESDSLTTIATNYFGNNDPVRAGYAWFYHSRTANNRDSANERAYNLLKAQEFAEKTQNEKLKGLVYGEKGFMYRTQRQFDSSIVSAKLALKSFIHIDDRSNTTITMLNIGNDYLYLSKNDSAFYYFGFAEKMLLKTTDPLLKSYGYRNLGAIYFQLQNFQQALKYYNRVPLTQVAIYDSNKFYLIAKTFIQLNQLDSARFYLSKIKELKEMAPDYYRLWQTIHEKEGDSKKAIQFANQINQATDSLYKRKLEVSFAGLEKKYKYQGLQLANQKLEISNKQKGIYLLFALLLITTLILIFVAWRLRVKKRLLEHEKALVEVEKEKFAKERENNLLLEKQVKFQNILMLNIEQHRKNSIKQLNDSIAKPSISNTIFHEELIACMDMEYNDISHRLISLFPNLTQQDVLICCLLLAGFDTGMISSILNVKIESMLTRRARLRTKLKLSSSDKLIDFLRHL